MNSFRREDYDPSLGTDHNLRLYQLIKPREKTEYLNRPSKIKRVKEYISEIIKLKKKEIPISVKCDIKCKTKRNQRVRYTYHTVISVKSDKSKHKSTKKTETAKKKIIIKIIIKLFNVFSNQAIVLPSTIKLLNIMYSTIKTKSSEIYTMIIAKMLFFHLPSSND